MALSDLNPFAGKQRVTLLEGTPSTNLGKSVEFDASKDEDHTGESTVTEFPVEEGSDISDHSSPKPRTISIHAFITGTPVSLLNATTAPSQKASRGKDAWTQMDKWRREGTRLTAITTLFAYVSVVITRLSVPRTANNSDGIEFTVSLKQVITASSKTVPKPVRDKKQDSTNIGPKPTKAADPPTDEANAGLLKSVSNALGKALGISQ